MDTQKKTVWVDTDRRILAFQPIENGRRITKEESLFWDYITELIAVGYRIT